MSLTYYGRDGRELHLRNALQLSADPKYKQVALDSVGPYRISTVWLGLDHNWGDGPPLIFETMVFTEIEADDDSEENFQEAYPMADYIRRYATEEEALMGHSEVMKMCEEEG